MSLKIGQSLIDNVTSITVPSSHIWILADAYVNVTPNIDGYLMIYQNGVRSLEGTPPLSTMLKHKSGRLTLPIKHMFRPLEMITINFIPLTINNSDSTMIESATVEVIQISFDFINLSPEEVYKIGNILEKQN